MTVTIDFETRSRQDIRKTGSYRYAVDPSTQILMLAYKLADDAPTYVWFPDWIKAEYPGITMGRYENDGLSAIFTDDLLPLFEAIWDGHLIEAHNAFFERCVWRQHAIPNYGWPDIPDAQWRCSAAKAAMHSLPRSLDGVGRAINVGQGKDMVGSKLLQRLCKPRKPSKTNPNEWFGSAEEFMRLALYCARDVDSEHEVSGKLTDLPPLEQEVWGADQRLNERGIYCDLEFVERMQQLVGFARQEMNTKIFQLTDGMVSTSTSRNDLLGWLNFNGCPVEDTQAATLDAILTRDDLPEDVLEVVRLCRSANRTSVNKFKAMTDRVNPDSRIRDVLMYHGAGTGRWSGKGVQYQNLPRGILKGKDMERVCDWLMTATYEEVKEEYADPMELFSSVIRGATAASPGKDLIVADYAAVEARGTLWAADDQKAMEVFRRGDDIYCDMASSIYGRTITKEDASERQLGKQAILGLGYGMGAQKFLTTCWGYDIRFDIDQMMALVPNQLELLESIMEMPMIHFGDEVKHEHIEHLIIAKHVVNSYRSKYWRVVDLWKACEEAAMTAIAQKDLPPSQRQWQKASVFYYKCAGSFLVCRLPSGRFIWYPYPTIKEKKTQWGQMKETICYMGVGVNGHWGEQTTYGGKLVENNIQGLCRDFMANALVAADRHEYYEPVLQVHDELVAEVPEGLGSVEEFEQLISQLPAWAEGFPLAAEGWRGKRYRK